jgi:hypothetical protein
VTTQGKTRRSTGHDFIDDFIDRELGKVAPYGVYDVTTNTGWVSVGIEYDTAEFAVESIRRWWREMGQVTYPNVRRLLITADGGGSNGYRVRPWRRELQKLADELRLMVDVCHLPSGTSRWNKIEHRMFCHLTANWRGRPLVSRQVVANLIGNTTTETDLRIQAAIDENAYASGIKVSDEELASLAIDRDAFRGEWNYRLIPRNNDKELVSFKLFLLASLMNFTRSCCAFWSVAAPVRILHAASIPDTETGKNQRSRLKALLTQGSKPAPMTR